MHKAKPQKGYQSGQHDVDEFMRDFLEVLNAEFLDNEIEDLFLTIIGQSFLCENCGNKTDNTLQIWMHPLTAHETNLEDAWASFMKKEKIKVTCEECQCKFKTRTQTIIQEPRIFAFIYSRFKTIATRNKQGRTKIKTTKIESLIETPQTFIMDKKIYR